MEVEVSYRPRSQLWRLMTAGATNELSPHVNVSNLFTRHARSVIRWSFGGGRWRVDFSNEDGTSRKKDLSCRALMDAGQFANSLSLNSSMSHSFMSSLDGCSFFAPNLTNIPSNEKTNTIFNFIDLCARIWGIRWRILYFSPEQTFTSAHIKLLLAKHQTLRDLMKSRN